MDDTATGPEAGKAFREWVDGRLAVMEAEVVICTAGPDKQLPLTWTELLAWSKDLRSDEAWRIWLVL